jgi:hypothetical protein
MKVILRQVLFVSVLWTSLAAQAQKDYLLQVGEDGISPEQEDRSCTITNEGKGLYSAMSDRVTCAAICRTTADGRFGVKNDVPGTYVCLWNGVDETAEFLQGRLRAGEVADSSGETALPGVGANGQVPSSAFDLNGAPVKGNSLNSASSLVSPYSWSRSSDDSAKFSPEGGVSLLRSTSGATPSRDDLLDRAQIVRSLYSVSKQRISTKDRAALEKDLALISKIEPLKDPAILPALHRSVVEAELKLGRASGDGVLPREELLSLKTKGRTLSEESAAQLRSFQTIKNERAPGGFSRSEAETLHRYLDRIEPRIEAEIRD